MRKIFYFIFLCTSSLAAQNLPPVISNVEINLIPDGPQKFLILSYDLEDAENDSIEISFRAGEQNGVLFNFDTENATGDVGPGILPGQGKQIIWDYSAYAHSAWGFRLQLVANDFQPVNLPYILSQVDSSRIYGDLVFLEGIRHRASGLAHLQETKSFIQAHFEENGLETYLQSFPYLGYTADNIIGRTAGTESEETVYILGAHFDTWVSAPGADDNASGVAGMLEAVRILSDYGFKKSIRFIGFDLEEQELNGSLKYVQNGIQQGESVLGMIDFEMIGYYTEVPNTQTMPAGFNLLFPQAYAQLTADEFRGNFITNVGGGISSGLAAAYEQAAQQYVPALKVLTLQPSILIPDLARSDHASFWSKNIPAIMLTDGANFRNPHYHTEGDTLGTLNLTFMYKTIQAAIATLAELAEIQHVGIWQDNIANIFSSSTETTACEWLVSPNPAERFLEIKWKDCQSGEVSLAFVDTNGRVLRQSTISPAGQQSHSFTFDLAGLEQGIYFLLLRGKDGISGAQKIVLH